MNRTNVGRIVQLLKEKRVRHRELARAVTWSGLVAILKRDRIPLVRTPLTKPAACLSLGGVTVILVNSNVPPRRHTYFVAHELAHAWLHAHEGTELCVHMDHDWADDPRENEAELVASWLLADPDVRGFLDVPEPPPSAVALEAAPPSLQSVIRSGQVVRAVELLPPPEPERVLVMRLRIDDADELEALDRIRREISIAFARSAWFDLLLDAVDRRHHQLLART